MALVPDARANRAATAEARRQKLLARGSERLSSITTGMKAKQEAVVEGEQVIAFFLYFEKSFTQETRLQRNLNRDSTRLGDHAVVTLQ